MNIGYIENSSDKVLVIDENYEQEERENTENINEILKYENRLEEINETINQLEKELITKNDNLKSNKKLYKKMRKKISIIIVPLLQIIAILLNNFQFDIVNSIIYLVLSLIPVGTITIFEKIFDKDFDKIKTRIEYVVDNLKKEKMKLEKELTQVKEIDKVKAKKENSNKFIRVKDNEYETYFDERLDTLAEEAIELTNKPKTLRRVRK